MKLFRRIYAQVAVGMLVLALTILSYLLLESARQNLADTASYKAQWLDGQITRFREVLRNSDVYVYEEATLFQDMAAVRAFRTAFGTTGSLYRNDRELFNISPYEFDLNRLIRQKKQISQSYYNISCSPVQTVNSRKMLLFYGELPGNYAAEYRIVTYLDVTDIYQRTQKLFLRAVAVTLLILLVSGTVLYRGIYHMLRPLLELKQAAAAIADGDWQSRAPLRAKDEIGELTVSFNRMADKVEEHMETLSSTNEMQRQLLGSLAHELKTPLTAIIGYADTLLTVRLNEKNRDRALQYICSEGRRLASLSSKMLELTGLYESAEAALILQPVSVADLLARLSDLTAFRRKEKNLRLELSCTPQSQTRMLDPDLFMSLLMNLVDNACKASPENAVIRICADEQKISVSDSGLGIPKEELKRVTEAFYMVDKSRSRSTGGAGLGLALCSQIASLHRAELKIESEVGKGTCVSVFWQADPDSLPAAPSDTP